MYDFLAAMWIERKIDKSRLEYQVTKKRISQDECNAILALPQKSI